MKKPKISVLCFTYNQDKYIKQCLDSIVSQKTNFDFEILIHDDASTDNTVNIIKEFKKKYPNIIKPVFQKENQYSKGTLIPIIKFLLLKAKGKYIALSEGDDFFTDKNKLQLQVDFLNKNPDYTICFHPVRVFYENKEKKDSICPEFSNSKNFTTEELLKGNFIYTNSVMFRRLHYKNFSTANFLPGDWYLHLFHAKYGKIGYINKVMSSYRRHSEGIWWLSQGNYGEFIKKYGNYHLILYFELLNLFNSNIEYKKIIFSNIPPLINAYKKYNPKKSNSIIKKIINNNLDNIFNFITETITIENSSNIKTNHDIFLKNNQINLEINKLLEENINLKNEINTKNNVISNNGVILNKIKSSKFFRFWQKYCNIRDNFLNRHDKNK